jgi:ribosomal protein S18 acetylase RimI-like enzyme
VSNISFSDSAADIGASELAAFFVGWPRPPDDEQRLRVLQSADEVVIARDGDGTLVGFVTAITDGVFAAYIPLVEVMPDFQRQGIGTALVERMLSRLARCYMIDLVCDDHVAPFYERLGGTRIGAIAWRSSLQ